MLISGQKSVLISLEDSINSVKNSIKRYIEECVELKYNPAHGKPIPMELLQGYDALPFFRVLLDNIFDTFGIGINEEMSSTQILINAGIEVHSAREIALNAFKNTISVIGTFVPDIDFSRDRYRIDFCGEYDILVAPQYEQFADDLNSYQEYER